MNFSKFVLAATMATVAGTKCEVNQNVVVAGTCTACTDGKTNVSGDDAGTPTTCDDQPFTVAATYTDGKLAFDITNVSAELDVGTESKIEIIFPKKLDGNLVLTDGEWTAEDLDESTIKLTPKNVSVAAFPTSFEITGITDKVQFDSDSKITVNYISDTVKKSTASIDVPDALEMASSGSSLSVLSLALLLVA